MIHKFTHYADGGVVTSTVAFPPKGTRRCTCTTPDRPINQIRHGNTATLVCGVCHGTILTHSAKFEAR
jgi:hypothetical protein